MGLPARRARVAAASHAVLEPPQRASGRCGRPRSASSANAPPASTADSWAWSPTSSTFAPAARGLGGEGVEGERAGQGGLVDDEQLPGAQRPPPGLLVQARDRGVQGAGADRVAARCGPGPAAAPATPDARRRFSARGRWFRGATWRCSRTRCPSAAASSCAAVAEGARPMTDPCPWVVSHAVRRPGEGGGLPGAGGADEHVEAPPGGGDRHDRVDLVRGEPHRCRRCRAPSSRVTCAGRARWAGRGGGR